MSDRNVSPSPLGRPLRRLVPAGRSGRLDRSSRCGRLVPDGNCGRLDRSSRLDCLDRKGRAGPLRVPERSRPGRAVVGAPAVIAPLLLLLFLLLPGCASTVPRAKVLVVTATAYNSLPEQTVGDPAIGAWGDRLDPAVPSIAVSPDLLRMGLGRGSRVRIEGFDRDFFVLDKMPAKWKKRIDIHMGTDRRAALQWGVREVEIRWVPGP